MIERISCRSKIICRVLLNIVYESKLLWRIFTMSCNKDIEKWEVTNGSSSKNNNEICEHIFIHSGAGCWHLNSNFVSIYICSRSLFIIATNYYYILASLPDVNTDIDFSMTWAEVWKKKLTKTWSKVKYFFHGYLL